MSLRRRLGGGEEGEVVSSSAYRRCCGISYPGAANAAIASDAC